MVRQPQRDDEAHRQAGQREPHPFVENEPSKIATRGPEGNAKRKFVCTLRDGEMHHAIHTNGGEQQRNQRERSEHPGLQAPLRPRGAQNLGRRRRFG